MRTRDLLATVYGQEAEGFQTRLADIAESLVRENEEREATRMQAAEDRYRIASGGPMLDHMASALIEAQNQALTDSRLPAVLAFDAYCVMKDASKAMPEDRGLKQASHALYDRWNQDPMGHLTVGELVTYRDHFFDMFPKSAAKQVFDEGIPDVGFNTLTNLPYLTRIASKVVDQDSYERAVEFYGLDGDRPEQIRARGYIKGIADLALSDENFSIQAPTLRSTEDRLLARIAQEFGDSEPAEEEQSEDEMPEDAVMAPGEEDLPHDENSEEMATIESPITGEPLVVELGQKEDEHAEGMEPGEEEESAPMAGPLPGAFEPKAQMMGMPSGPQEPMADPMAGGSEDENDMVPEGDGLEMGETSMENETMTTIIDPTSGEELQMTLKPIEDEQPFEGEGEPEGASPLMDELDEMGGGSPMEQEGEGARMASAPSGWEPTVRKMKKHKEIDNPFALANWMKNKGYKPHAKSEKKGERGMTEAMNTNVPTQQGPMTGTHSETDATKFFNGSDASSVAGKDESGEQKEEKKSAAKKLSKEQVFAVCAGFGLTPDAIEERLLDGDEIATGAFALRIGERDDIELRRLVYSDSTQDAKLVRTAALGDFDSIVGDFMALTAAQFAQIPVAKPAPQKTAAPAEKQGSYVVTSDVPHGAPINARRMMASVWKILPEAEGELMDDGRLAVLVPSAQMRDINRVARVLSDVFGVVNIESQQVEKLAQLAQHDSPYRGLTPVARQPAGAPAKPMQAPMQTPMTGAGAQQDFIARHTDPMKQAEVDCAGCAGGEPHEMHARTAQMEDEMPPEEGGEELPPEGDMPAEDPAMAGGAPPMDPMMGGGMGMPGMDPMMGMGMPGMPMPGGMGGGMGGEDASQMPIDIGMGQLQPQDDAAVRAAMAHFRNMGMTPLEALDKFTNAYAALFDKYGDAHAPARSMAEAAVIRAMSEAWAQPSVVPAKKAGADRTAEMPSPRPPTQHPGQVTVKKDWKEGDVPAPAHAPAQHGSPDGGHSKTKLGPQNTTTHSFGGDKKPGGPQKGSRHDQTGESWPSTEVFVGTNGNGDGSIGNKMDSLSRKAPSTPQSTKKGEVELPDFLISFDPALSEFNLHRSGKLIRTHESMNAALADAERCAIGTGLRVLIDDGMGGFEEI